MVQFPSVQGQDDRRPERIEAKGQSKEDKGFQCCDFVPNNLKFKRKQKSIPISAEKAEPPNPPDNAAKDNTWIIQACIFSCPQ
mmetsp:Transcript_23598/g.56949  ORF Transcript_23598/g.56949 Transcript_23598/m.56949 type:complete len:83 (-) Transcript_23598:54-302(-)